MTYRKFGQKLSKPEMDGISGISPAGACILAGRQPVQRRRDPVTGSCAERGNLCHDAKGEPGDGSPVEGRVPMRDTGADGFVVVMKPGNAGGAKGPDFSSQGQRSTGNGRSR
jgi:hypothetical protein